MQPRTILNSKHLQVTIERLCYELVENHNDFSNSALVGLQPRGIYLLGRIQKELQKMLPKADILSGNLDPTFHRDDFRRRESPLQAKTTDIDFVMEDMNVVLIDDVLFTGRTIRAGLEALLTFGRPRNVELLVLIDRRFSRHLPIQPDYTGKKVDTVASELVKVEWEETEGADRVIIFTDKK